MRCSVLFVLVQIFLQHVFSVDVVAAQERPAKKYKPLKMMSMKNKDAFLKQKGAFKRDIKADLHKVSKKLAAHHKGDELMDEETLKRTTKHHEYLTKMYELKTKMAERKKEGSKKRGAKMRKWAADSVDEL